jgi:hypothetical protein
VGDGQPPRDGAARTPRATGPPLPAERAARLASPPDRAGIDSARSAIEGVLRAAGRSADLLVSRWDEDVGEWRQIDPPLADWERKLDEAHTIEARRPETRTLTCVVGRLERAWLESYIVNYAQRQDLECTVAEDRHLLSAHLTFSVSGPAFKLDEFVGYARRVINSLRWTGGAGS